ncbi:MAG: hypothetical protein R3D28_07940 [Geminicoccaceae bacterium]
MSKVLAPEERAMVASSLARSNGMSWVLTSTPGSADCIFAA